eukprot:CAMPEP_0184679164 /NCGR_PEP_ID=MMETSP0312-20130426/1984_1 /TAXON_ID=31354 /ORGANISM="Compsopogon coeruleus, Strain SAG 36.94" /LENGTH=377 /DNA_ID=CAMNT_0027128439 /DNA_START=1081 /DNA_END=2214 /DNA_ORIENTATION=-
MALTHRPSWRACSERLCAGAAVEARSCRRRVRAYDGVGEKLWKVLAPTKHTRDIVNAELPLLEMVGREHTPCAMGAVTGASVAKALRASYITHWTHGSPMIWKRAGLLPKIHSRRGFGLVGLVTCSSATSSGKTAGGSQRQYTLSPSDFAFLWDECPRCYYYKVHGILSRPRLPFPSIFNRIDLQMRSFFRGKRTEDIFSGQTAPAGEFLCEEDDAWVESQPINVPSHPSSSIVIRGKIDCLIRLDDGSYAVIDFKTSNVDTWLTKYDRQLEAYATAMENPAPNADLEKLKVSQLGLVVFEPSEFGHVQKNNSRTRAELGGSLTYIDRPRQTSAFSKFLQEVVAVLDDDSPPVRSGGMRQNCPFCSYADRIRILSKD